MLTIFNFINFIYKCKNNCKTSYKKLISRKIYMNKVEFTYNDDKYFVQCNAEDKIKDVIF